MIIKFIKTKFPLFALSLLLSFIFWLMVSASGTSTREMIVDLDVNLPDEKVAVLGQPLPDKVSVRVEANTAQFKLIENRKLAISVDLSNEAPRSGLIRFNIDDILAELQLPRGVVVSRIQPAEIPYQLYGFVSKVVPVEMSLTDVYNENVAISGPLMIEPSEVEVRGPSNIMENVTSIPVVVSRASVTPGVKMEVKPNLSLFGSNVEADPSVVFMVSPNVVWKRTDLTVTVPVTVSIEIPDGGANYAISANPETVSVAMSWPANHPLPLPGSSGGAIALVVADFHELERLGGMRLEVNVTLPFGDVTLTRVSPSRVNVSLRRLSAAEAQRGASPQPTAEAPGQASPGQAQGGDSESPSQASESVD
ncbi:MAG: hypothetical protein LBU69_04095 [Deltaproteobacteria bacterium]|nr:hypothetical protein [Deltaproteobacteria bacterium]